MQPSLLKFQVLQLLYYEPFPKPSGSDNKILDHPQNGQTEHSGE
jgi:hypothetical protein